MPQTSLQEKLGRWASIDVLAAAFFVPVLLLNSACASTPTAPLGSFESQLHNEIKVLAEARLEMDRSPGLNLGVVVDGDLVFHETFGFSDTKSETRTGPDTGYQIGSVTKTFVGLLAARLAVEGIVDLDTPISVYTPELKFHENSSASQVTLRHLLSHQSGLPNNPVNRENIKVPGLPKGFDPTVAAPYGNTEIYEGLKNTPSLFSPGEKYHYSNFGVTVAGYVLAQASQMGSVEEAIDHFILSPLEMHDTYVRISDQRDNTLATPYAYTDDIFHKVFPLGTKEYHEIPAWTFGTAIGGAGLTSTVPDLAKYLSAMMDLNNDVLTAEMKELALSRNVEFIEKDESVVSTGLGWRSLEFGRYGVIYQHSGHNDGHHATILYSQKHRIGVVSLSNGSYEANRRVGSEVLLLLLQNLP